MEDIKMEMTFSRKFLNVAGILEYIWGGLSLVLAAVVTGAGIYVMNNPGVAQALPRDFGDYTLFIVGIAMALGAVFSIIYGRLERAAAKDPAKIMPVWVLSILSVVLEAGGIVLNLAQGAALSALATSFLGLSISILVLVVANNIKKDLGR